MENAIPEFNTHAALQYEYSYSVGLRPCLHRGYTPRGSIWGVTTVTYSDPGVQ